jgi:hypothetical protein
VRTLELTELQRSQVPKFKLSELVGFLRGLQKEQSLKTYRLTILAIEHDCEIDIIISELDI